MLYKLIQVCFIICILTFQTESRKCEDDTLSEIRHLRVRARVQYKPEQVMAKLYWKQPLCGFDQINHYKLMISSEDTTGTMDVDKTETSIEIPMNEYEGDIQITLIMVDHYMNEVGGSTLDVATESSDRERRELEAMAAEPEPIQCPDNEHYSECGTACPKTCASLAEGSEPIMCTKQCVLGCVCNVGFVRSTDTSSPCQRESDCAEVQETEPLPEMDCLPNEVFTQCGTTCPDYCGAPEGGLCTADCMSGCECQEGFVRTNQDVISACIPADQCPSSQQCGENQHFTDCGTACEPTCGQPTSNICTANCVIGCVCDDGFLKSGSECVRAEDCPSTTPTCADNEVFDPCYGCEFDCSYVGIRKPCTKICRLPGRCKCKRDFYRHNEQCVEEEQCPPRPQPEAEVEPDVKPETPVCPNNEEFKECGTACEPTCDEQSPNVCTLQCIQGCFCQEGHVRNNENTCIPVQDCPLRLPEAECADGEPMAQCYAVPCQVETCPKQPEASCQNNYCGGCNAQFFLEDRILSPEECNDGPAPDTYIEPECPEHEEKAACHAHCQKHCRSEQFVTCTRICVPGCVCSDGYIRNESNGVCVARAECANKCHENEVFDPCGGCETSCINGEIKTSQRCDQDVCMLPGRCRCRTGLTRNESGECVANCLPQNPTRIKRDEIEYEWNNEFF